MAYNPADYYVNVISRGDQNNNEKHEKCLLPPAEVIKKNFSYEPRKLSKDELYPIEWHE